MIAPTSIRSSEHGDYSANSASGFSATAANLSLPTSASIPAVARPDSTGNRMRGIVSGSDLDDYNAQNEQTRKQAFLDSAAAHQTDDYLRSTREPPMSSFEIKSGWEIPAILEQGLNSDLPGELKALVAVNVYDTATGQFLLIPAGISACWQVRLTRKLRPVGRPGCLEPNYFPRRFFGRSQRNGRARCTGECRLARQGRSPLQASVWFSSTQQSLQRCFRCIAAAESKHPKLSESDANSRSIGQPEYERDRVCDYAPQSECAADYQSSCGVSIHGSSGSRHFVRRSVRAAPARSADHSSRESSAAAIKSEFQIAVEGDSCE